MAMAMPDDRRLTMILKHREGQYVLVTLSEKETQIPAAAADSSSSVYTSSVSSFQILSRQWLSSAYPLDMSFISMAGGTKIYMVGGRSHDYQHESKRVYIYDVVSETVEPGPELLSGKCAPILISIGPSIYALSRCISRFPDPLGDQPPLFEVLDTTTKINGWLELPLPHSQGVLPYTKSVCIYSWAVYGPLILISVRHFGVFAFNTSHSTTKWNQIEPATWKHLSPELFPFDGYAHCRTTKSGDGDGDGDASGRRLYYAISFANAIACYAIHMVERDQLPLIIVTPLTVVIPTTSQLLLTTTMPPLKKIFRSNTVLAPGGGGNGEGGDDNRLYIVEAGLDTDLEEDEDYYRPGHPHVNCFVNVGAFNLGTQYVECPNLGPKELLLIFVGQTSTCVGPMASPYQHILAAFAM